ncbi:MAG: glycosyltransferase family 9 protein, partial [Deltaproteobacteria bacterium]|nr:glycosyltransferase family 9 protein [Deltaproteobacteria bacterium]
PHLDRVIISHRKRWIQRLKVPYNLKDTMEEILFFIKTLRDRRYDLAIDFHGLFKSAFIISVSRARRKLGYDSMQELSGLFYNEKIFEDMGKHAVDRYLDIVQHLGGKADNPEFIIQTGEENKRNAERLLRRNSIDIDTPFVAINPVALWETKLWQDEKFARLADGIIEELGMPVVFTGGAGEKDIGRIQSFMKNASVNLEGQTSLKDLAYLYRLSALLVTTDSGPMHIAAAVGAPVVALFGPTDPLRTGPYGSGHTIISRYMDCSPCFRKNCGRLKCMMEITTEEVMEAVKKKIRGQSK